MLLDRDLDGKHVVCGVTCSRQHSSPDRCLVNWTVVDLVGVDLLLLLGRQQPDIRHVVEQDVRQGFVEAAFRLVPTGAVNEQAVDVAAVSGGHLYVVLFAASRDHLEVEVQSIDRDFVLN